MSVPSTIQAQKDGFVKPLDPQENAFRLEIDEFVQNRPLLNVFLLALEALQDNKVLKPGPNATEEDWEKYWWSFYSIAGKSLFGQTMFAEINYCHQGFMAGPKGKIGATSTKAPPGTPVRVTTVSMESRCFQHGIDLT